MPKLPRLRGKELIRSLTKLGFEVIRIRGSYFFLSIQTDAGQLFQKVQQVLITIKPMGIHETQAFCICLRTPIRRYGRKFSYSEGRSL